VAVLVNRCQRQRLFMLERYEVGMSMNTWPYAEVILGPGQRMELPAECRAVHVYEGEHWQDLRNIMFQTGARWILT
jgi:hypothetical protein